MIKVRKVTVTATPAPLNTGAGQVWLSRISGEVTVYLGGPDVNTTDKGIAANLATDLYQFGMGFNAERTDDILWAMTETDPADIYVLEVGLA